VLDRTLVSFARLVREIALNEAPMVITTLSRTASSAGHWRALAIALGRARAASACATPIGVSRGDTQAIYRDPSASVLSTGQPSSPTRRLLLRRG
jgi:hypothetical protein